MLALHRCGSKSFPSSYQSLAYVTFRICHLLELWIRDYPYDFAVRGTAGALSALIKSIISKTYLLHYGSDFLPFLELLPTLVDKDSTWALKIQDSEDESDDGYSLLEDDDESMNRSIGSSGPGRSPSRSKPKPPPPATRERKASLPLTAKTFMPSSASTISNGSSEPMEYQYQPKQQLKDLLKIAQEVNMIDPEEIAQEITRLEVKLFLDIEVSILWPSFFPVVPLLTVSSRDIGSNIPLYRERRIRRQIRFPASTMSPIISQPGQYNIFQMCVLLLLITYCA